MDENLIADLKLRIQLEKNPQHRLQLRSALRKLLEDQIREDKMGNMSHCRFRNTLGDLEDCWQNMDDNFRNKDEAKARIKLIKLCQKIAGFADEEFLAELTEDMNEMSEE